MTEVSSWVRQIEKTLSDPTPLTKTLAHWDTPGRTEANKHKIPWATPTPVDEAKGSKFVETHHQFGSR